MIRKATINDIDAISSIYEHIHDMAESGKYSLGWIRGVYPTKKLAEEHLKVGDLFVCEHNGNIVGTAIINKLQLPEYADGNWNFQASPDSVMVLHTLAVDPYAANTGVGAEFLGFYEDYARRHGCTELRIDTQTRNMNARRFYPKFGFQEIGIVKCEFYGCGTVDLVLMEKHVR